MLTNARFDQDASTFSVATVQGGITNLLYRVSSGRYAVLFRVFGAKTEMIIDRSIENRTCRHLTARGFGALMYGHVRNGRVEEWLTGKSLRPDELRIAALTSKIGDRLAELHLMDLPFDKQPSVFRTIEKWMKMALDVRYDEPEKAALLAAVDLPAMHLELTALKPKLEALRSPVVFAHNDLLSGNVMFDPDSDAVTLIDFEYASYNYRAFDIANHFCECCGFDCDWDKYPSREQQNVFFCSYLLRVLRRDPNESELDALFREVGAFMLIPHLFWGTWAVLQSKTSPIDFDFLSYATLRMDGFRRMKSACLQYLAP